MQAKDREIALLQQQLGQKVDVLLFYDVTAHHDYIYTSGRTAAVR